MSESSDYNPGPWTGYDFKSARASYDRHVSRSYSDAVSNAVDAKNLVPEHLKTDSEAPLVIACDVTGSMGDWPATIFSKLPYLDLEGKEYLGETMEISFAAVGDCFSDRYPLQVQPFVTGLGMKDSLSKLVIEGNGGGQSNESYDLAALYYARNVEMPNAINPILIFIGDEGLYDFISKDHGKSCCKVDLEDDKVNVKGLFEELKSKYAVYLIRKPYGSSGDSGNSTNSRIQKQWEDLLGADHVSMLPEASRVVDVIFGILAKETGRIDYFRKEINDRQTEEQVDVVLKSLATVHLSAEQLKKLPYKKTGSVTRRTAGSKSKSTKSLLDD